MIAGSAFYNVMTAIVPLYVAMILGYGSVKWWRRLTPEQCSEINRFVSDFAVPLLSFHFISTNNPYTMNLLFIAADTLQKVIVLALLVVCNCLFRRASLEWAITIFSLSTLPNTLVMGIPLLKGMYGDFTGSLMVQTVVFQSIIWYTLMLVMFEYRSARNLIAERFPDEASSITGIAVGLDVESFDGQNETLETVTEVKDNGGIFVTVRRSNASGSDIVDKSSHRSMGPSCSATPRPSNLTNAEIYSLPSSRNPTPRVSSFNSTGRSSSVAAGDALGLRTGATPTSSIDEEDAVNDSETAGRNDRSEEYVEQDYFSFGNRRVAERDVEAGHEMVNHEQGKPGVAEPTAMPPTGVLMSAIPVTVWRRLIHNPNTYSSVIGLIWSLFCFRWNIEIPAIILLIVEIGIIS